MRTLRWMLELIALCGLLAAGIFQLQQVDFDLAGSEQQEDLRLRDYVISHDLEYVKGELIALQKERWSDHAEQSSRSWLFFVLVIGALVLVILSRVIAWRMKNYASTKIAGTIPSEQRE